MYSSSSYSSPYTSSYLPPKRYTSVTSSLPPLSSRYVPPSRYSTISTPSSRYISKPSTVSSTSRYSSGSSYSNASSFDSQRWRSSVASPSLARRDLSSTPSLSRRPSFSSGLTYRSGSISSLSSPVIDTYRSTKSYGSTTSTNDEWTPRTSRVNSISSVSPPKQTAIYSSSNSSGCSSNYKASSSTSDVNKLARRVGLHNLGNTCFMNAVLQCLCHTRPLIDYCKRGLYQSDLNRKSPTGGDLIKAFSSLISVLWKDNAHNAVSPDNLKRELQKYAPRFAGCNQQDAQELLRYLLHGLHDDINKITTKVPYRPLNEEYSTENQRAMESWRRYQNTDDSKIVDIFGGQLKSTLKCTECSHTSVTFDPFWDISLPIPDMGNRINLQQCFRQFTSPEVLEGSEKPLCERCKKKTRSTKQLEINKFPVILVIHLKRFSSGSNYRNKLNVLVDYEIKNLDLSRFAANSCSESGYIYDLYGVVDHFGSSSSGHYTAKCRSPSSGEEWNEFNDNMVVDASAGDLITDKAYLLFFEQSRGRRCSRL